MVSTPPFIMGGLNLKFCWNFVGTKFFHIFVGEWTFMGELKLHGGVIFITTFHYFISLERANNLEKWSVSFRNFFWECEYIRSCDLPIASNLIKKSFRKTSLFVVNLIGVMEKKYFVSCIFETNAVIIVIKILENNLWRSSVLERNF